MEPSPTRNLAQDQNSSINIPSDLAFEILSRLPAKSIIRFQSVSKFWYSIIRSKDLSDLFLIHSKTRPRLLFTFKPFDSWKRHIFSAPEHGTEENSSTARHDMTISDLVSYYVKSRPVNGLICCTRGSSIAVCNPTTRQILKLPDVRLNGRDMYAGLGYDPVQDQYKVLCVMKHDGYDNIEQEHFVFTLGCQQKEWKKIENIEGDPYRWVKGGICINGAIYYVVGDFKIARFDVRSEKVEFINAPQEDMLHEEDTKKVFSYHYMNGHITTINAHCWTLVNHQGKLGGTDYRGFCLMRLWIKEEKEDAWKIMTCDVPTEWRDLFLEKEPSSPGEIHTGEVMLVSDTLESSKPFTVYYYDMIRESFRSATVEGITDNEFRVFRRGVHGIGMRDREMLCFPGHIENIMFLSS